MTAEHGIVDLPEETWLALKAAADAQTKLMSLLHKRDELATRFTGEHPGMVAIERQISAVRHEQQNFEQTVRRLPALQQQTAELKLDMHVATDLYKVLLGSTQQLQLIKAGRVASARIVDVAVTAEEPVRRNRSAIMLLTLFGGAARRCAVAHCAFRSIAPWRPEGVVQATETMWADAEGGYPERYRPEARAL